MITILGYESEWNIDGVEYLLLNKKKHNQSLTQIKIIYRIFNFGRYLYIAILK